ncbi:methylmalonyl Co-A mutase-associated GTPase MeaB, partial [Amycolatopsis mediterranei]
ARRAARELAGALRMIYGPEASWTPPVLTCSGLHNLRLDEVWGAIEQHRDTLTASGELDARRRQQQVDWTWAMVREQLLGRLAAHPEVRTVVPDVERAVRDGELTATLGAQRILDAFGG